MCGSASYDHKMCEPHRTQIERDPAARRGVRVPQAIGALPPQTMNRAERSPGRVLVSEGGHRGECFASVGALLQLTSTPQLDDCCLVVRQDPTSVQALIPQQGVPERRLSSN